MTIVHPPSADAQAPLTEDQRLVEWDWLITPYGEKLHHARLDVSLAEDLTYHADLESIILTCGRWAARVMIPGLFTRMSADRCKLCCKALGYPEGTGSPKNDDTCHPFVEARIGGGA